MFKRSKKFFIINIFAVAVFFGQSGGGLCEMPAVKAAESAEPEDTTKEPEQTQKPEFTKEPGQTQKPETTKEPGQTQKPETTKEPEQTQKPSPTETPEPTKKPEYTGDADEYKNLRILNLKCDKFDKEKITISWDEIKGTEKYEIWCLNEKTNGYDMVDECEKSVYTFEKLERGEKLTILVRGYVEVGDEKVHCLFSDMITAATIPDDVKNLAVKSTTDSAVTLSWDIANDSCSYKISRCPENGLVYENVATVKTNTYTDTKVSAATPYTYKVSVVVEGTEAVSENSVMIITCTPPKAAYIKQFKGGSFRSRLRWNKVNAGDGYIIYMRDIFGQLTEITRINDINATEYIHYNLINDAVYKYMIIPYKIYNGIEYKAEESNEIAVTVKGHVSTMTKPAVYKKVAKLRKSKLYKKYSDFAKTVKLGKSYVIPGIEITNNLGFESTKMVTQAICFADNYLLITAYDIDSEETSVVYVLDKKTRKYICTLSLPDYYHAGGMAYDGTNIWVSTGKAVSCFGVDDINNAILAGQDSVSVKYKTTCEVKTQASFITYYKKKLWIGEHNEKSTTKMYGYSISGKKTLTPTLAKKCSMKIPSRTQDVAFLKNGKMIVSCSNQISAKASKYYISQLMIYKPDWSKKEGYIKAGKCAGKFTMPPMIEGIAYQNGYLYVSFESAAISGCSYKMDRICAMKYKKIKWKK